MIWFSEYLSTEPGTFLQLLNQNSRILLYEKDCEVYFSCLFGVFCGGLCTGVLKWWKVKVNRGNVLFMMFG